MRASRVTRRGSLAKKQRARGARGAKSRCTDRQPRSGRARVRRFASPSLRTHKIALAVSRATGTATFTLADGSTLTAHYDGSAIACTGCTVTRLGPRVQRVQVTAPTDLAAGGLTLQSVGVTRRLR
ncbi:MAG: hypothetical protein ABJE66_15515 [Deltaproteobacteria bacterium]